MSEEVHVIFGAGQVGPHLAERLLAMGHRVRIAKRSRAAVPEGAELVNGDAASPEFCLEAARGAAVVYHCMNPPYYARIWARLLPLFVDNLVAAAGKTGARLVVLDNLYMLGRPADGRLNEDTPIRPCSRKGEIRARAAERLLEAHRNGEVLGVAGRASDYYGPRGTQTHMGDAFWSRVVAGRSGWVLVNPDAVHTYHYIPDVAAGLAVLGSAPADVYGRAWMLPCAPAGTLRDLVARFSRALGREIGISVMPRWLLKVGSIFVPFLRELEEMAYQWDGPFVVDDSQFRSRFGLLPADPDEAARATIAWARVHYAGAAGR